MRSQNNILRRVNSTRVSGGGATGVLIDIGADIGGSGGHRVGIECHFWSLRTRRESKIVSMSPLYSEKHAT